MYVAYRGKFDMMMNYEIYTSLFMTGNELRKKFIDFFVNRGHVALSSSSLVPLNDPSVLFTTAGMHPLVPYLLGEAHPLGTRLTSCQKCVRTGDIDEVGDNTHLTFFEMLGNWSLGDYFKKESIFWSFEFLTSSEWLNIPLSKLAVSVFAGDSDVSRDDESAALWTNLGISEDRIAYLGKDDNWWPAGGKHDGPQGPDTEIFYWTGEMNAPDVFDPSDKNWVEIWNNVFMQFKKTGTELSELAQKNVDTGMGLERTTAILQGKKSVFETELFLPLLTEIERRSNVFGEAMARERSKRIICDHIRTAVFMLADRSCIVPSNVERGYVLRRLIRRAIRHGRQLQIHESFLNSLADIVISDYQDVYPELRENMQHIHNELSAEEDRFSRTISEGLKEFEKMYVKRQAISGIDAFQLYATYGFPLELTQELMKEKQMLVDETTFHEEFEKHQKLSRENAGAKFKGGLADHSEKTVHGHTATHLLHQALRTVLGNHVEQRGSNITTERLRFDFTHSSKMTDEEKKQVEDLVNQNIQQQLPITCEILSVDEAKARGAIGLFDDAYAKMGEHIKVYFVGNETLGIASAEICGGPHVKNTHELGIFKIVKEEAVASGIRRIKAVVE